VKLCPVDLDSCDRPYCRGGHCELAEESPLTICWECGAVDSRGIVHGICVTCITLHATKHTTEET
jgi:hypothetical protein